MKVAWVGFEKSSFKIAKESGSMATFVPASLIFTYRNFGFWTVGDTYRETNQTAEFFSF